MTQKFRLLALVLVVVMAVSLVACGGGDVTEAPETDAPVTDAPETEAPETDAPETEAPETEAPETEAPETEAPETEAPKNELIAIEGTYVRGGVHADTVKAAELYANKYIEVKGPYKLDDDVARAALIKFDIAGVEISKATLKLVFGEDITDRTYDITKVSSDWSSATVTANTAPAATDVQITNVLDGAATEVDITTLVKAAKDAGETTLSIMITTNTMGSNASQTLIGMVDDIKPVIIYE